MDDDLPFELRQAVAQRFLDEQECCLDEGFSLRFRALVGSVSDIFLDLILRFLRAVFHYAIGATTHMEVSFAHMMKFLQRSWRPPHIACVAEHHTLTEVKRAHARWLDSKCNPTDTDVVECRRQASSSKGLKGRPVWAHAVKAKQGRNNQHGTNYSARNAFVSTKFDSLRARYPRRPLETRTSYNCRI